MTESVEDLEEFAKEEENDPNFYEDGEIEESIGNLYTLKEDIEKAKERRSTPEKENSFEESHSRYRSGEIVPKPEGVNDRKPKTGDLRNEQICVWVRDKSTGDAFIEYLDYPNRPQLYDEYNEYTRLCSVTGTDYSNPEELLFKDVPIDSENDEIHLPESAAFTSKN